MELVSSRLSGHKSVQLGEIFSEAQSMNELITILLATLELIKVGRVRAQQTENFGQVTLTALEGEQI